MPLSVRNVGTHPCSSKCLCETMTNYYTLPTIIHYRTTRMREVLYVLLRCTCNIVSTYMECIYVTPVYRYSYPSVLPHYRYSYTLVFYHTIGIVMPRCACAQRSIRYFVRLFVCLFVCLFQSYQVCRWNSSESRCF